MLFGTIVRLNNWRVTKEFFGAFRDSISTTDNKIGTPRLIERFSRLHL